MDIYELMGYAIGDGHIFYSKKYRKYRLELVGNVEEDYDYFKQLIKFLSKQSSHKPHLFITEDKKGKTLRIMLYDKAFVEKLISHGLQSGSKTFTVRIDEKINGKKLISLIRGLFEADGCLYFSNSKRCQYPTYPRIEIKTSSRVLLKQLKEILKKRGFNTYIRKWKGDKTPAVGVSGEKSLEKWRRIFGFVSLKNKTKYGLWKTKGFYIPHTPLKQRMKYAHVA